MLGLSHTVQVHIGIDFIIDHPQETVHKVLAVVENQLVRFSTVDPLTGYQCKGQSQNAGAQGMW